jgi:transposase InsO family protein
MAVRRPQRVYDHRLVRLVQETRDTGLATRVGVPRSTVAGWLRRTPRPVTPAPGDGEALAGLRRRVAGLERRCRQLLAVLRLLFALLRVLKPDLARRRVAEPDKARLLRAVDRTRGVLGLRRVLSILGLSPSRLSSWRRAAMACELADQPSCPGSSPQRLTPAEVSSMRELVTSPDFRHVPTGRLALLAQRLGTVFASATTWHRMTRERGWRRPRLRVHPEQPRVGVRASRPDEVWHADTTVLRLLDGTKAYIHAVIDNFSRRILAWRVADRFDPANALAVLVEAGRRVVGAATPPTLLADQGVENVNAGVDALVESGLLRRVLAQTEVRFSNSMIEAWWRSLKHGWLFLHPLDSVTQVRRLVEFYVVQHNARLPHSAFRGQTPDEMYFGTGDGVPDRLAAARAAARRARLETHRAQSCAVCA